MGGQDRLFSFSQHVSLKSNKSQSKPSLRSTYNCSKTLVGLFQWHCGHIESNHAALIYVFITSEDMQSCAVSLRDGPSESGQSAADHL